MARHQTIAPSSTLPASLIFTSHEQKHYRRYQRTKTRLSPHKQGYLPSADEYTAFQCWLKKRDSGYFSDEPLGGLACYLQVRDANLADLCKHALHPFHKGDHRSCCPVCIVEMHMRYMRLLEAHVTGGDSKVQQRWESTNDDPVVDAWRAGKLSLLRAVDSLEKRAIEEHAWMARNPGASIENAKTAEQALHIYHTAMQLDTLTTSPRSSELETNPIISTTPTSTSAASMRDSSEAKPRRTVCFDADTDFTLGRSPHYFWRRSPRYKAGKYTTAATSDSTTEKTAFLVGASDPTTRFASDGFAALELGDVTDDEDDEGVEDDNISFCADAGTPTAEQHNGESKVIPAQSSGQAEQDSFCHVEDTSKRVGVTDLRPDQADSEWQDVDDSDSELNSESDSDEDEEDDFIVFEEEETSFIVFAD